MRHLKFALPLLAASGAAFVPLAASAALSGFYDSGAQIAQILGSSELGDRLRQLPVQQLDYRGTQGGDLHEWQVVSEGCNLQVLLRAVPPKGVGATSYVIDSIGECG